MIQLLLFYFFATVEAADRGSSVDIQEISQSPLDLVVSWALKYKLIFSVFCFLLLFLVITSFVFKVFIEVKEQTIEGEMIYLKKRQIKLPASQFRPGERFYLSEDFGESLQEDFGGKLTEEYNRIN